MTMSGRRLFIRGPATPGMAPVAAAWGAAIGYGRGVAKDPAKARQLFIKGCGLGNQWGCDRLKELK